VFVTTKDKTTEAEVAFVAFCKENNLRLMLTITNSLVRGGDCLFFALIQVSAAKLIKTAP
jgi:hypothetical protein